MVGLKDGWMDGVKEGETGKNCSVANRIDDRKLH